jgi:hypothetical protein
MTEPFWRAPRRLRRLLEDGEATLREYGLLNYFAHAGADRGDGVVTSYDILAGLCGVEKRTIARWLQHLQALELITYDLHQGQRHPFRVRLGPAALVADSEAVADDLPDALERGVAV